MNFRTSLAVSLGTAVLVSTITWFTMAPAALAGPKTLSPVAQMPAAPSLESALGGLRISARQHAELDEYQAGFDRCAQPYLATVLRIETHLRSSRTLASLNEARLRRLLNERQFALNELIVLQFRHRQSVRELFTPAQRERLDKLVQNRDTMM